MRHFLKNKATLFENLKRKLSKYEVTNKFLIDNRRESLKNKLKAINLKHKAKPKTTNKAAINFNKGSTMHFFGLLNKEQHSHLRTRSKVEEPKI